MGNNPVGKKVNTPKINTRVNTFLLLALGFYLNPIRRPDVCRRRGTEVRGQTKTRRQNMLVCSQRVSELAASATAAKPARYGRVIRLQ